MRFLRVAILLLVASQAFAQTQRMFVSSAGVDSNPCSRLAPCRNFNAAAAAVVDGGEVVVLDSAGYGPVQIGKSVSIIAPDGVYAGISASGGDAITINAPSAKIVLRGLTLNTPGGTASYGIHIAAAAVVHVENCVVSGFSQTGLVSTSGGDLFLDDDVFRGNTAGLFVAPAAALAVSVDRCRFERNASSGIHASGANARITVHETFVGNGSGTGIDAFAGELNVNDCVVVNHHDGIAGAGGATISVSGSLVADHAGYGFSNASGGTFRSFRSNQLAGNGTATYGTITTIDHQ